MFMNIQNLARGSLIVFAGETCDYNDFNIHDRLPVDEPALASIMT